VSDGFVWWSSAGMAALQPPSRSWFVGSAHDTLATSLQQTSPPWRSCTEFCWSMSPHCVAAQRTWLREPFPSYVPFLTLVSRTHTHAHVVLCCFSLAAHALLCDVVSV